MERPECLPICTLIDPAFYFFNLFWRKLTRFIRRGHSTFRIVGSDPAVDSALRVLAGHDGRSFFPAGERTLLPIEPQVRLPFFAVRSVALIAGCRENRPDVSREVDFFFTCPHNARHCRNQEKK